MILVMVAIGFCLALTYGFMRTQLTSLQVTQNESRRDLALEAARTGISAGLLRMQDPAWVGLGDTYSKVTQQDSSNNVSIAVSFSTLASGEVAGVSDAELPFYARITSVGTWKSPRDTSMTMQRTIKAVVRLTPRVPGRAIRDGDIASATDVTKNPSNYAATLPFTLTATGSPSTSLEFDPGARFEGPIWLNRRVSLYSSENWSNTIRNTMLSEIGNQYGSSTPASFVHPHPLNGPVQFSSAPTGSIQSDLSRLKTSWTTVTQSPSVSSLNTSSWQTYRLYDRGPTYQAVTLSGSLSNVTLRPSVTNPLGIFIRTGNLDIYDSTSIQGTLVVTGTLSFNGQSSAVTSYNWVASNGAGVLTDSEKWPRLPAIVAKNLNFSASCRQEIEGAVVVDTKISGGGGNFGYATSNGSNLTGTATATRNEQPYSTIQLLGSPNLSAISGNQLYAIWLSTGNSGRWYPISSIDTQAKQLKVIGEANFTSPVNYQITANLASFARIHGPVVTGTITIDAESMWNIPSYVWNNTYSNWDDENDDRQRHGQPLISFPDWISNPLRLVTLLWFMPTQVLLNGLQMEPTFTIQPTPGVDYLDRPPLFTPYVGSGSDASASGYRWKIVDWREDL